jgi:ornithine carbamoyltransferase
MARDYLTVDDLSSDELAEVLDLAAKMKADRSLHADAFRGKTVALIFEKASTRTRVSFEVGVAELGGHPLTLSSSDLQLGRGETIEDTGRVLSRYVDAIVLRTFEQERLEVLAAAADVPVVNSLSDFEHPCQALADLLTIREHRGSLAGTALTYLGDGNNVAHSLLEAGALSGVAVAVASPDGYEPHPDVVALARATGGDVEVVRDPVEAVQGAHAVYTDVWVSMGDDEDREVRTVDLAPYLVDASLVAHARPDAVVLHCLPAHRGEEVSADVLDGPRSVVWQQAANRLPTEQALLWTLLAGSAEERPLTPDSRLARVR